MMILILILLVVNGFYNFHNQNDFKRCYENLKSIHNQNIFTTNLHWPTSYSTISSKSE